MRATRGPEWLTSTRLQGLLQGRVVAIDVIEKANLVFFVYRCRAVHDQNRDSRNQIDLNIFLIAIHGGFHTLQIPSRIVSKHPRDKIRGLVHSNAPVTEIAYVLRKQLRHIRPMEIHILRIGKNDLHKSE